MSLFPPGALADASADPEALIKEARRHQRRRQLLTALATAVALAAAAGVVISQSWPGGHPATAPLSAPLAGTPATYANPPAYYAYPVQGDIYNYVSRGTQYSLGVPGRYLKVRATATGKLLATVSPPVPYNNFSLLTADSSGRTFVLGARRFWQRNAGPSPRLAERDQRTPMKFLLLRISPGGRTRLYRLSLPATLTPAQTPSIALSPDGTRLAVAFGGHGQTATVEVITLGTGRMRQWVLPHTPWTPVLSGDGAWAANGRTLMFAQQILLRGRPFPAQHYRPAAATRVRLLDTTGPGSGLASSTLLVLHPPAGKSAPAQPVITPDGTKLISAVGPPRPRNWRAARWTGELAVYSARTGALLRTLAPWVWHWPSPPGRGGNPTQTVAWSNRTGSQLIVLQPRNDLNILGTVTGNTFTPSGSTLLPQRPAGYRALQDALRTSSQMTW